jgi:hypothetical protein
MPKIDREKVAEVIRERLRGIAPDQLLPMPYAASQEDIAGKRAETKERRRIAVAEWEEYSQRCKGYYWYDPTYEQGFGRPANATADRVWDLLKDSLQKAFHSEKWRPRYPWLTDKEKGNLQTVFRQALVIVMDLFIQAGENKRLITYTHLFDALAERFSDHHRESEAATVRDMSEQRVKACRRDLLLNGVPFNKLWDLLSGAWSAKSGANPLFLVTSEEYIGLHISLRTTGAAYLPLRRSFERILREDSGYRRASPPGMKLLLDGERVPDRRAKPREICSDQPYNIIPVGKRSQEVLKLQRDALLFLDAGAFLDDYQRVWDQNDGLARRLGQDHVNVNLSNIQRRSDDCKVTLLSERQKHVFYRSIEWGLNRHHAWPNAVPGGKVDERTLEETVQQELTKAPKKWQGHLERYRKWWPKHQRPDLASPPAEQLTPLDIARAAVAMKSWRQQVQGLLMEYDQNDRMLTSFLRISEELSDLQKRNGKTDDNGNAQKRGGCLSIRSGFYRLKNCRYQPTHFWPTYVSKKQTIPAEGLFDPEEEEADLLEEEELVSYRKRWFKAPDPSNDEKAMGLVSLDVSSSQTQILAAFLHIDPLLERTMNPDGLPFKEYLAELAWNGDYLKKKPECYRDAKDKRLIALVKDLWMRRLYGSEVHTVVHDQRQDRQQYGPGWNDTEKGTSAGSPSSPANTRHRRDTRETSGPKVAADGFKDCVKKAEQFLSSIPGFSDLDRFLSACRKIARLAFKGDPYAGVSFTDPLDGQRVRWNPVKSDNVAISSGDHKLIVRLPGRCSKDAKRPPRGQAIPRESFSPAEANTDGDYPVNSRKLQNMIAPCLVHMLDAYFSSLVMERLAARGIRAFAGIHDCWMVPERVIVGNDIQRGLDVLEEVITEAGEEWYTGLGPVYDDLLRYLGSDQEFGDMFRLAKEKWEMRVRDSYSPPFLALPG